MVDVRLGGVLILPGSRYRNTLGSFLKRFPLMGPVEVSYRLDPDGSSFGDLGSGECLTAPLSVVASLYPYIAGFYRVVSSGVSLSKLLKFFGKVDSVKGRVLSLDHPSWVERLPLFCEGKTRPLKFWELEGRLREPELLSEILNYHLVKLDEFGVGVLGVEQYDFLKAEICRLLGILGNYNVCEKQAFEDLLDCSGCAGVLVNVFLVDCDYRRFLLKHYAVGGNLLVLHSCVADMVVAGKDYVPYDELTFAGFPFDVLDALVGDNNFVSLGEVVPAIRSL